MKTYYTLVVKHGDTWCPEFGSYDYETTYDESSEFQTEPTTIVVTSDEQADIDKAIAKLNRTLDN